MVDTQTEKESIGIVIHTPEKYDRMVKALTRGREHEVRESTVLCAGLRPGEKVLDLGCGTGSLAREAKKAVGVEGIVVGIDPSKEMVSFAQQKAAEAHLDIRFEQGMIQQLPFPDQSFDVAFMSLVFHHMPAQFRVKGIQEMYRVLKEHGRLVILEFAPPKRKIKRFFWFFVLGHMVLVNIDKLLAPVREGGFKEIECSDTPWEVLMLVKCSK